ncbi:MAG: outer membrane protein transport protein [Proteobacteria bacterium]|nr:outer membrane protein transport protein [Pseudomonadota bacterium]
MKKLRFKLWAVFTILILSYGSVYGAGFQLIEQSVSGLGNAYAGGSASAEDATTIFFNPAGMTRLNNQFIAGIHFISPSAKFHDEGSSRINPLIGSLGSNNGGDGGVSKFVPNIYYLRKLSDKSAFGLGINVPFGLGTEYPSDWIGRYHAIKSDMMTININPSFAYRITDKLSFGFGVSAQYIKAELSSAVDQKLILASNGAPVGVWSVATDAYSSLEGDAWGYGYNAGLLYEFSKDTRFGLSYRSRVQQSLKGDVKFSNVHPLLASNLNLQNRSVTADVDLPDTASASFYSKITPKLAVMADVSWTKWSRFKELRVKSSNGASDILTTENWDDNYRYSLGLSYYATDKRTYRFGIAYDETPVTSPEYRTPRIPDGSRKWISAGLGYKFSDKVSLDLGAAYLFVNDPKINQVATTTNENATRGNLKGTYDCNVKILSAQLNYNF